jgi:hypothetical protein
MKISEYIERLEALHKKLGDVEVLTYTECEGPLAQAPAPAAVKRLEGDMGVGV